MTRPSSLQAHLLRSLYKTIVPVMLVAMAGLWYFAHTLLEHQFRQSLVEKATTLATLVTSHEGRLGLEFADEYMPQFSRAEDPLYFQIWYPDGAPLERSYSLRSETGLPFLHGPVAEPATFKAVLSDGTSLSCVGIDFPLRLGSHSDEQIASVVIVVGSGHSQLGPLLQRAGIQVVLVGGLALAGLWVAVRRACRGAMLRLEDVGKKVERVRPDEGAHSIDVNSVPSEIGPLVLSLNRALRTIGSMFERERRFNSDVAHELRTPIAELRTAADVAIRWPESEAAVSLAEDVRAVSMRMTGLVESLLELASLEAEPVVDSNEPVHLAEQVRGYVHEVERHEAEGRTYEVTAGSELAIQSQPHLWDIVIRNLIDNARDYSPPGSRIRIEARTIQSAVQLEVCNPTDSLSEEDVALCTERLWKKPRDPGQPQHFGLGLSIVEAATSKLGLRFRVQLQDGVFCAVVER